MKDQRRTGSSRDFRSSTINCPLTPSNPFRITYIRKNAPANPYGSHIYKTKDLKSFQITYYEKGVGGTPFSAQRNLPLQVTSHESGATNHGGSFTSLPSFASCLRKLVQRGFHFGTGVVVAFFLGDRDPSGKNLARFSGSSKLRQQLAEVEVAGDVVGTGGKEFAEMLFGGGRIAGVHTFHRQTVAGKGVAGFGGDELFEFLAARLGRLGHESNRRIIAGCSRNTKPGRSGKIHHGETPREIRRNSKVRAG